MSTTPEYDYYYYVDPYWTLTPTTKTIIAILIGILIFIVIIGNLLTVISYIIDSRLRTVYDFYIFNLAFADMLLGAFSMPLYARATMVSFYWELGKAMCKLWLTIDFTLCSMSVILILFLSYDRLMLVTLGTQYTTKVTIKRARIQVVVGWALAFFLYGPAEIFWDTIAGFSTVPADYCDYEFSLDITFTMITAVIEFVVPIIGLGIINFLIYRKIRMRTRASKSTVTKATVSGDAPTVTTAVGTSVGETMQNGAQTGQTKSEAKENNKKPAASGNNTGSDTRLKRDTKAAKVLATIVIVFLVTWAPFTLTSIIISFCDSTCVNENWYEIMGWLLWSKSAINPFLYALNSTRYRYNFKRIVFFWKRHAQVYPVV